MDDFQKQIQRRLVANIIMDKCAHYGNLIFSESLCTQDRIIRFTTEYFRGKSMTFEAANDGCSLVITCVPGGKTWTLNSDNGDVNTLFEKFDDFIESEVPKYEEACKTSYTVKADEQVLKEGEAFYTLSLKYERNRKAREACLAANGTACKVCGIDFEKAYGPDFAGKIEVHHIVPISEIGEEYVVDPVHDLVPVCPNCHMALHSKKDGVYTVEELIEIRAKH